MGNKKWSDADIIQERITKIELRLIEISKQRASIIAEASEDPTCDVRTLAKNFISPFNLEEQALLKEKEELETQLGIIKAQKKKRHKNDVEPKYVDELIKYLEIAGMKKLAANVSKMRYAYKDVSHDKDNKKQIVTRVPQKQKRSRNGQLVLITDKDAKNADKKRIQLTQEATKLATEYRDLYELYAHSEEIVRDIKARGVPIYNSDKLVAYFNDSSTIGYQYLEFYHNYGSSYQKAIRQMVI